MIKPDIMVCPVCGTNVDPDGVPSYSVVFWDGKANVLVQMFCEKHPPSRVVAPPSPAD